MSTEPERTEDIIVTHANADFDALGSMIAARLLYPEASLVFPGGQEKNIRDFFISSTSYLFNFKKPKQVDLSKVRRLIIVDTRQKSRIGAFARIVDMPGVEIHIYDHHPSSEDDIEGHVVHLSSLGSNTAMMCKLLREKGIVPSPIEATIMCLGIHEDTGSFTFSSTTPDDYMEAGWLAKHGVDQNLIAELLSRELSAEQVRILSELLGAANKLLIDGQEVIITRLTREEFVPDLAILIHKLMEMENIKLIFAIAQMEDKVYIIARNKYNDLDVSKILSLFGGGGHPYAASATIKDRTLIQVENELVEILRTELKTKRTAKDMMSSPVISVSPDETLHNASQLLNRYNINVLLVMDKEKLKGYVTRQVIEKAIYFGLENAKVQDYMNLEFVTVAPDTPLTYIQELIVKGKHRIIPVADNEKVVGVITRTDLLQILLGEEIASEPLYQTPSAVLSTKNTTPLLKEFFPKDVLDRLIFIGKLADEMRFNAYLVGGVVRDLLLRRQNLDLDVVVEGDGIELATEVGKRLGAKVRPHRKFGTALIIFDDDIRIDVATARIEYYEAPGAPPIVEMSCLKRDMFRRDFTINTMAIKLNERHFGTLIDYYGGLRDIKDKILRVLHNLSFVEDPTRMLRAIRFEQRFGFKIGRLTLSLLRAAVKQHLLLEASGHRIYHELVLILNEEHPVPLLEKLDEFNMLGEILGADVKLDGKSKELFRKISEVLNWYKYLYLETPLETWRVYLYALMALLNTNELISFTKRMGMTDKRSKAMISNSMSTSNMLKELNLFEGGDYALRTLLKDYDTEFLLFLMAKTGSDKVRRSISRYLTKIVFIKPYIKGRDLLKLGITPGPIYKLILDKVLEAKVNGLLSSKQDEMDFVKNLLNELGSEYKLQSGVAL